MQQTHEVGNTTSQVGLGKFFETKPIDGVNVAKEFEMSEQALLKKSPSEFVSFLKQEGINRFCFVYDFDKDQIYTSHQQLEPIAKFFAGEGRDYLKHEGIFFNLDEQTDTLMGAFIHCSNRGQAAGGTRFWVYNTVEDFLRDGTRLSAGMTRKNALAGLWTGGGKGVIVKNDQINNDDPKIRKGIFRRYGDFVTSLQGCYITAEDAGTNEQDIGDIFSRTRFAISIPEETGGSGNPSIATARGVVCGMEAGVEFLGHKSLEGLKIAIQGMGNVGGPLIDMLFEKNVSHIVACDIYEKNVKKFQEKYGPEKITARVVKPGDFSIFAEECDVLAPCAMGAVLNEKTIPTIKAKLVCGAANNQLEDPQKDDVRLSERDILYVPDFLVNRMGIVNCAYEEYGYVEHDPLIDRHLGRDWEFSIHNMTQKVLQNSKTEKIPPGRAAIQLADRLAQELHPLFGNRGRIIIRSLLAKDWTQQKA